METILGTAALAAITALCIIAYRHPKGYTKIYKALCDVMIWAVCAIGGFGVGIEAARQTLTPYIEPKKIGAATRELATITPSPFWTAVFFILILGFFVFLLALPSILEHQTNDDIKH